MQSHSNLDGSTTNTEFTKLPSQSVVEEDSLFDEELSEDEDEKRSDDSVSDSLPEPAPFRGGISHRPSGYVHRSSSHTSITTATSSSPMSISGPAIRRDSSHSPRYASPRSMISSTSRTAASSAASDSGLSVPPRVDYMKHRTASLNGVHTIGKALERMGVTEDEIKRAKPLRMLGGSEDTFIESGRLMRYNPFEMYRVRSLPRDRSSQRLCASARDSSHMRGSDFSFGHPKDYIFTDDFWADESTAEPRTRIKKRSIDADPSCKSKTPRHLQIDKDSKSVPGWAAVTRSCPSSPCRKASSDPTSSALDISCAQADILGLDAVFDDIPLTSDEDPALPELVIDVPTPPQSDATAVSDDDFANDGTNGESPLDQTVRYPWSKPVFASRSHLEMFQQRHHRSSTEDTRSAPAQMPARVRKMFGDDFAAARKANRILGTDPKEKLDQRSRMLGELGEKDEKRIQREKSAMDSSSKATFKRNWIKLKRSIISRGSKDDSMGHTGGGSKSESSRHRSSRSESVAIKQSRRKSKRRESALGKIGSLLIRTNSNEGVRGFVQSGLTEAAGEEETTDSQQSLLIKHEEKTSSLLDTSSKRRSEMSLTSLLSLGSADDTSFIRQPSTLITGGMSHSSSGIGISHSSGIGGSSLSSTVRRKKKYIERLYLEPDEVQSEHRELVVDFVNNDYTLEQVIEFFIGKLSLSSSDTLVILDAIDECRDLLCQSCDQRIKQLHDLSPFQYIVRTQVLDVERFFHKYGPRICRYHNIQSPLHLAARRLAELARDYQTHIVKTSPPELRIALKSFQFLMSVGYYLDDADWSQTHVCTPRTLLKHTPRVLKQIDDSYRKLLKNQRISMKLIAEETHLPLVLLRHLEFFTYNQIPRSIDYMITNQHHILTRNRTLDKVDTDVKPR